MKNQDTITLWGTQDKKTGKVFRVWMTRQEARAFRGSSYNKPVKLSCQIVPQKRKKPHNFGLPAHLTPHNPDNLTPEQVGEGFRLLAKEEIWERDICVDEIEMWLPFSKLWEQSCIGCEVAATYRVSADWPLDINPKLKTK